LSFFACSQRRESIPTRKKQNINRKKTPIYITRAGWLVKALATRVKTTGRWRTRRPCHT